MSITDLPIRMMLRSRADKMTSHRRPRPCESLRIRWAPWSKDGSCTANGRLTARVVR